jgi:hypothetical protein
MDSEASTARIRLGAGGDPGTALDYQVHETPDVFFLGISKAGRRGDDIAAAGCNIKSQFANFLWRTIRLVVDAAIVLWSC